MKKTIKLISLAMLAIFCFSSVEVKAKNKSNTMDEKERMQFADKYFASYFNAKTTEEAGKIFDEQVADDFVDYSPFFGNMPDKAGFRKTVIAVSAGFDEKYVVEKLVIEGDMHVAIWRSTAKHVGNFLGMPASGKEFTITGITVYKIVNGKIKAHWEQFDVVTMMKALGMMKE